MCDYPKCLKKWIIQLLYAYMGKNGGIPILKGPLKNSYLPKTSVPISLAMLLGRYEPGVVSELLSGGSIRVAYDIGAHLGFMSLVLAKLVGVTGRVFAFEPIPENRLAIDKLVAINRLEDVVQVIPLALADCNGTKRMLFRQSSLLHQFVDMHIGKNQDTTPTVEVETCTIDSFVFEQGNPFPEIVKIDVEGAEELVLRGALKTLEVYAPTLVVEIHGSRNAERVWKLLKDTGYLWWQVSSSGRKAVRTESEMLSDFSYKSWTQHFLLTDEKRVRSTSKENES
jgi:FkbM family methyltransferase